MSGGETERLLLGLCCGLLSNVLCELLLVFDMNLEWFGIDARARLMRLARWAGVMGGSVIVAQMGVYGWETIVRVVVFGLFSVSAGMDFESSHVPPDWYVYGSAAAGVVLWGTCGLEEMRRVVAAVAVCYGVMVAGVAWFNAAAGGDIKLALQYGGAAGGLNVVLAGFVVEWIVRVVMVGVVFGQEARCGGVMRGVEAVAGLRAPHGPLAWVGLVCGWLLVMGV